MFIMFFGERQNPCSDCAEVDGKMYCTMNCGPAVPVPPKAQAPVARPGRKRKADKESKND